MNLATNATESEWLLDASVLLCGKITSSDSTLLLKLVPHWTLVIERTQVLTSYGSGRSTKYLYGGKVANCWLRVSRTSTTPPSLAADVLKGLHGAVKFENSLGNVVSAARFALSGSGPSYEVKEVADLLRAKGDMSDLYLSIRIPLPAKMQKSVGFVDRMFLRMLAGENLVDTTFVLYSCRKQVTSDSHDVSGMVTVRPKSIYASSSLLIPTCDYFSILLSPNGFSESQERELSNDLTPTENWEHGYESDSDLEEEESVTVRPSNMVKERTQGPGRVIVIKDFAYNTWEAMLFYFYTDKIIFLPLSGDVKHRMPPVPGEPSPVVLETLPSASAKSIYRLADKLGLEKLGARALAYIKSQLTVDNIVQELFSTFTSWFPKVREMELEYLFSNWEQIRDSSSLEEKLNKVISGELPHAGPVLFAIVRRKS